VTGELTCVCTEVRTDHYKVDYCIDPTDDNKPDRGPVEPHQSNGQAEGQGVKEIHKSKLDKVNGSPAERGEDEGPLGDVQDSRDILSEWDRGLFVHGFNEIQSV
jgi:hypothetical protein